MIKLPKLKPKKAQQLVEFLFVAPFLIIFLGILTEYAYALNINMTITQTLKNTVASVYKEIKPNSTPSDIRTAVLNNLKTALTNNNVPLNTENNLKVAYAISGDTAVFTAEYTYIPAFTLPNTYFKFLPDSFDFFTSTAVPSAFLGTNQYDITINSDKLDKIWSSTANFSTQDSFDSSKKGVMKNADGRPNVLFLISNPAATPLLAGAKAYAFLNWDGTSISSGSATYNLNLTDGNVYLCDSSSCNPNTNFMSYIQNNDYYNIIFVDPSLATTSVDYINSWANDSSKGNLSGLYTLDLSDKSYSGILKSSLALITSSGLFEGNYDNIDVSSYNSDISAGNNYNLDSFGSVVFMHPTSVSIANIINGHSASDFNNDYDFGTRVN